jgi:hypothetical protein
MNFPEQIVDALAACLDTHPDSASGCIQCTEYDLLRFCQQRKIEPISNLNLVHSHALFQAHFLVRHALYLLQQRYHEDGRFQLQITLTRIERRVRHGAKEQAETGGVVPADSTQALRDYYLNLDNLFNTGETEVEDLLRAFWQRLHAFDGRTQALATLGLGDDADNHEARRKYRQLAQRHHPDKGGDAEEFRRIRAAMEVVLRSGREP